MPGSVRFANKGDTLYMIPNSDYYDTNWYKYLLADAMLKISANDIIVPEGGRPITDRNEVDDIVKKFKPKYFEDKVKIYYTKFVVADKVPP